LVSIIILTRGNAGKAGGFLALDWNDGSAAGPLSRLSYSLYKGLAEELEKYGGIDYREVSTFSVAARAVGTGGEAVDAGGGALSWLDRGNVLEGRKIAGTSQTAQVHPRKTTEALLAGARARGATLREGKVEGVRLSEDGARVEGVVVDGEVLPADVLVLALGPWTSLATQWLPVPPVVGQRYHSAVLAADVPAECLFTQYEEEGGATIDPEVYPRPHGEVYVCGFPDAPSVPEDPRDVKPDDEVLKKLRGVASSLSSALDGAEMVLGQSCYLPCTSDGAPAVGPVPGVDGAYVATGHSCWGILNAPATGLALAELIVGGKAESVDLTPLYPDRFFTRRR